MVSCLGFLEGKRVLRRGGFQKVLRTSFRRVRPPRHVPFTRAGEGEAGVRGD